MRSLYLTTYLRVSSVFYILFLFFSWRTHHHQASVVVVVVVVFYSYILASFFHHNCLLTGLVCLLDFYVVPFEELPHLALVCNITKGNSGLCKYFAKTKKMNMHAIDVQEYKMRFFLEMAREGSLHKNTEGTGKIMMPFIASHICHMDLAYRMWRKQKVTFWISEWELVRC